MSAIFNGSNSRLYNTTDNLGLTAYPFTVAAWIKYSTSANGLSIWRCDIDSVTPNLYRALTVTNYNTYCQIFVGPRASSSNAGAETINTWIPVIYRFTSTEVQAINTNTPPAAVSHSIAFPASNSPQMGLPNTSNSFIFNGKMATFTVWNVDLSAANRTNFLNGTDPALIDAANQTRNWDLRTASPSLTDTVGSIVLTNSGTTTFDADDPVLSGGTAQPILMLTGIG